MSDRTQPEPLLRAGIEMITANGFRIVYIDSESSGGHFRYRVFRHPSDIGSVAEVQVTLEAMCSVERVASRRFEPDSPYWESLAQDVLATFLWNENYVPSEPIVVWSLCEDDLRAVNFWPLHGQRVE